MKVTGFRALSGSPKSSYELLTSGATAAQEREDRVESEPVSDGGQRGKKDEKSRRRMRPRPVYRFFVSKHDANASLKKRAPSVSA